MLLVDTEDSELFRIWLGSDLVVSLSLIVILKGM